jgi:hypothetical protein
MGHASRRPARPIILDSYYESMGWALGDGPLIDDVSLCPQQTWGRKY